jgi:hypothetical protein
MKYPIIRSGVFRFSDIATSGAGELSIFKFVKNLLTSFGVAIADECCPTTTSPTRYNETTNVLEYYNQVSATWEIVQDTTDWNLLGNAGTNPSLNFIGTTDDKDIRLKRNAIDSGYLASSNTSFGVESGDFTKEGSLSATQSGNTNIGRRAGGSSTGSENTFVGSGAGRFNTEQQASCVGLSAGASNSGLNLVALGFNSGISNSGVNATSLGASSGNSNSGDDTVAIGFEANSNNSGDNVISLGRNAGKNNNQNNRFIVGLNYLPTFAGPAVANAALPASSANGVYLYIDSTDGNTIKARI